MYCRWIWLFLFFCSSVEVVSTEETSPVPLEEIVVPEMEHPIVADPFQERFQKMLVTLFGLIAFMILGAITVKQLMKTRLGQANQSSAFQLLETRVLSHKLSLHLVEIDGDRILVGETASHVSLLALPSGMNKEGENR